MGLANNRAAIIDEYGELSRQLAELDPIKSRHELLRKVIQGWFDAVPADEPAVMQGRRFTLQVSPKENSTKLKSIRAVFREMGENKFLDHCSITLKAVKDVLGEERFKNFATTDRTGYRTLKAVAKAALRVVA